jgi:hypothetical protein
VHQASASAVHALPNRSEAAVVSIPTAQLTKNLQQSAEVGFLIELNKFH